MTRVIECHGLTAGYDGVAAVHDIDLHVDQGEVVALLGPNGAGKTTTLLAISGVIRTMGGSAEVCGKTVRGGRPHLTAREGLAVVPDDRSLFYGLTTRQNIRLALRGGRRFGSVMSQVLEYFPLLGSVLDRRAGLLSGGEQQMLAIGRALATEPKALVVDEMSLGLAPIIVQRLMPTIRRIATELGTAVLVVEQHVDLALKAADRAYVLDRGRVVLTDDAEALRSQRDVLRASYMGELVYEGIADNGTHQEGESVSG